MFSCRFVSSLSYSVYAALVASWQFHVHILHVFLPEILSSDSSKISLVGWVTAGNWVVSNPVRGSGLSQSVVLTTYPVRIFRSPGINANTLAHHEPGAAGRPLEWVVVVRHGLNRLGQYSDPFPCFGRLGANEEPVRSKSRHRIYGRANICGHLDWADP